MVKKILISVVILGLIGGGVVFYMINKPHPKAENAKAITFKAEDLANEYNKDEKAADAKYLNKVIEVTGIVTGIDHNQDGGTMAILQTSDPNSGIQCTLRDKGATINKGQTITIKGFCSGNGITGISLTDCVIVLPKG